MKILKQHQPIINLVLEAYLQHFKWKVEYYTNKYDPEHKQHHGWSIDEKLQMAERELREEKSSIRYYEKQLRNTGILNPKNNFILLDQFQLFEAVKQVIRQQLRFAYDHDYNKFIVQRGLKKSVLALDLLRLNQPEYEHITARFFLTYNNLN